MSSGWPQRIRRFLRDHFLVVGFVAAVVPLATLLVMQVRWLTDLDRASKVAHEAALRSSLEAIGNEVAYFYRSTSERLLNVPAAFFERGDIHGIGAYWQPRPREGVRRLFAIDYTASPTGNFYFYTPELEAMEAASASDESLAVVLAALAWQRRAAATPDGGTSLDLYVNEQDPSYRVVLKPVASERGRLVGVVGLVIDTDFARASLFGPIVETTIPTFFPGDVGHRPRIDVRDGARMRVLGEASEPGGYDALLHVPFVLRDWTIGAVSTQGQAVTGSLGYNLALGFALAFVLAAGIAVALLSARKAMRLSEMKSTFVSNVSHELRTPLASIRLFAEMMKMGRVRSEDKVVEYGGYIEAESRRLSRLIDNILDFSRIESNQKGLQLERWCVLEVVEPVLETFSVRLKEVGIELHRDLPESPGPTALLDADAIGQALHNLLDNAAKYAPQSDRIVVRVCEEDDHLLISVEDRGIGIAKADQARVFERFHRVGTGLVHDVKGSGLGLALVEHTARAHGGRVTLDSEPGQGSTFSLWLPLDPEAEGAESSDR